MKRRAIFIASLLLLYVCSANAQYVNLGSDHYTVIERYVGIKTSKLKGLLNKDDEVINNYLYDNFVEGQIVLKDGSTIDNVPLNYCRYTEHIHFIEETDTFAVNDPHKVDYVAIGDKKFIYTDFTIDEKTDVGFFELLADGECKLLKRIYIKFVPATPDKAFQPGVPAHYRTEESHFIKKQDLAGHMIYRKKDVYQILSGKKDEIAEYAKKEKLKLRKEQDLVKLVSYYNHLQ